MCNQCNTNNCGCNTTEIIKICNTCKPVEDCACPVKDLSTDCILYTGDKLDCSGIENNTILTEVIKQLDTYICERFETVENFFRLVNIGTGAGIYKGIDGIGRKQIKSLIGAGIISITEQGDTITITASTPSAIITEVVSEDNIIVINKIATSTTNTFGVSVNTANLPKVDGSETKVTAGTNISITGNGTVATPYIVNSPTIPVNISAGSGIDITGNGTSTPYTISSTIDGSETKVSAGTNVTVTGSGTTDSPYVINSTTPVLSYQKVLNSPADFTSSNYTLTSADNDKLLFIFNGVTNVTITVPTGLPNEFFAAFIQKGTGDVTFVESGTTVETPLGLKIKGIKYQVALDKVGVTNVFNLTGNTRV